MERVGELRLPCKQPFLFKGKKQYEIRSATVADSLQVSAPTHFSSLTLGGRGGLNSTKKKENV